MKWRHTDGGSAADTEALHVLLRRIELQIGELGHGEWSVSYLNGKLSIYSGELEGLMSIDLPSKHGGRVRDWIIDAVIARKQLRKKHNDLTLGASK